MDASTIAGQLRTVFPDVDITPLTGTDVPTLVVPRDRIVDVCRALRDGTDLAYTFLSDLTCVDYWPASPRFEVVYNLVCLGVTGFPGPGVTQPPRRLRLLVRLAGDDARVPTLSGVFRAANWAEREVYDLFGIVFEGHPDLRRLLLPDDWEGHPLRKDYPVQVKVPVKTYAPLQLSEEEFVANMERLRAPQAQRRPR
jgi:NADH-quinone oxidoreductase subunit C